jgi:hypothetical protein
MESFLPEGGGWRGREGRYGVGGGGVTGTGKPLKQLRFHGATRHGAKAQVLMTSCATKWGQSGRGAWRNGETWFGGGEE